MKVTGIVRSIDDFGSVVYRKKSAKQCVFESVKTAPKNYTLVFKIVIRRKLAENRGFKLR